MVYLAKTKITAVPNGDYCSWV